MPHLLCRILKLRKISAKNVLKSKGQEGVSANTFLLAASKSYSFANFSKLDFDWATGTNSSFLPKMTFIQIKVLCEQTRELTHDCLDYV